MGIESLGQSAEHIAARKRKYFSKFAIRHLDAFRPHFKAGEVLGSHREAEVEGGIWRNVSEHCLVAGVMADILAEQLGLRPEERDLTVRAMIIHDWSKKREKLELERLKADDSLTLEAFEEVKKSDDEVLRTLGVSDEIIQIAGANIPSTEEGPQTDPEKIIWYVDMIMSDTRPVPLLARLDAVEQGWNEKLQANDPARAQSTRAMLDLYKPRFHGRHLNEVQRSIAPKVEGEFAERIGAAGPPAHLPYYLNSLLAARICAP